MCHPYAALRKTYLLHLVVPQYSLVTGVYPIYDVCSDDKVGPYIRRGERPYIDPRWEEESFAEAELVNIIQKCWEEDPDDRPAIGELVLLLRESVKKNRELVENGLAEAPGFSSAD